VITRQYGIRFVNDEEVIKFLTDLSQEVARRLRGIDRLGRQATLKIMVRNPDAPQEAPKVSEEGFVLSKQCS
jgi:DNA repair protein REV1